MSKREHKYRNIGRPYTSKSSGIGQKDTKANLVLPPSAHPTVQISSNIFHLPGNASPGNWFPQCGVEVWRGGLGGTYRLPALSFAGASLFPPCFRFHTPLIEPDVQIYRIRLSEKTHAIAKAIACDAVCNF